MEVIPWAAEECVLFSWPGCGNVHKCVTIVIREASSSVIQTFILSIWEAISFQFLSFFLLYFIMEVIPWAAEECVLFSWPGCGNVHKCVTIVIRQACSSVIQTFILSIWEAHRRVQMCTYKPVLEI